MTFLEFVLTRFVGPPHGRVYQCPFREHGDPYQVVVNEPRMNERTGKPYPVKGRCHRGCGPGPGGCFDEYDVVRAFYPNSDMGDRTVILADLREKYEAGLSPETEPTLDADAVPFSSHGEEDREMAAAWALMERLLDRFRDEGDDPAEEFDRMERMWEAGRLNGPWGWLPARVVACWEMYREWQERFQAWREETNRRHFAECEDPGCDWIVCRAGRGLPPLTKEELARDREERNRRREAERQASEERIRLTRETILRNTRRGR